MGCIECGEGFSDFHKRCQIHWRGEREIILMTRAATGNGAPWQLLLDGGYGLFWPQNLCLQKSKRKRTNFALPSWNRSRPAASKRALTPSCPTPPRVTPTKP